MNISASNSLKGKVTRVKPGAVAIISNVAVERLGLQDGEDCYAVIKATDITVGTDH